MAGPPPAQTPAAVSTVPSRAGARRPSISRTFTAHPSLASRAIPRPKAGVCDDHGRWRWSGPDAEINEAARSPGERWLTASLSGQPPGPVPVQRLVHARARIPDGPAVVEGDAADRVQRVGV